METRLSSTASPAGGTQQGMMMPFRNAIYGGLVAESNGDLAPTRGPASTFQLGMATPL